MYDRPDVSAGTLNTYLLMFHNCPDVVNVE